MPPRLRSNNTHKRNLVLMNVVNRHKNDPKFLASLISTGIRGNVRREAQRHLNRLKNIAERNILGRMRHLWNTTRATRRNRALLGSAIRRQNITPEQRNAITNVRRFIEQGIRPLVGRLRRIPNTNNQYTNPNIPGSVYILNNRRGNLLVTIPGFGIVPEETYRLATGVRRLGRNRLNY